MIFIAQFPWRRELVRIIKLGLPFVIDELLLDYSLQTEEHFIELIRLYELHQVILLLEKGYNF